MDAENCTDFIKREDVKAIVEECLLPFAKKQEEFFAAVRAELIKQVRIKGFNDCESNLAIQSRELEAIDPTNAAAGKILTLVSRQIPTDICAGGYTGASKTATLIGGKPRIIDPRNYNVGDRIIMADSKELIDIALGNREHFAIKNTDCAQKCIVLDARANFSMEYQQNIAIDISLEFSEDDGANWLPVENRGYTDATGATGGRHDHIETHLFMNVEQIAPGETWSPMLRHVVTIQNNTFEPFEIEGLNYGFLIVD